MFDKIVQWLYNIFGPESEEDGNEDVTVDEAIINYQKYQEELKEQLAEYIKSTCSDIKKKSRNGRKHIYIEDLPGEFDCPEYIQKIRAYFESRGFTVETRYENESFINTRIKISWM